MPRAVRAAASGPVGRNDPCPCGSGRKYKHCHGRLQRSPSVLYIHPTKQGVDAPSSNGSPGRPYGLIPLGIAALANVLAEAGFEILGVNLALERSLNPAFDLKQWLAAHSTARLVMVDLHWYEHTYGALSVARVCKEVLPRSRVVLGGITASLFAREILADFPEVDFVIRGDAERPLLHLVQSLSQPKANLGDIPNLTYRLGKQIVQNPLAYTASPQDLDVLDFADLSFLEHATEYQAHEYVVTDLEAARRAMKTAPFRGRWLCSARGCRYECSYCGGCTSAQRHFAGRGGVVPRSPGRLVEDLEFLAKEGVQQASFSYDICDLGDAYWSELFSLIRNRGVHIGLYNEVFGLPSREFIEALAETADMAHSCLALSPLSGSERVRHMNGKRFSNDDLLSAIDVLSRYNVPIFVYFSLNLPGEDGDTLRESIRLASIIYDLYPTSLLKILNSCHTMDPLSPMSTNPAKYGIEPKMHTLADYYSYCQQTQFSNPLARTEAHRGFVPADGSSRQLEAMADMWDEARMGREAAWWPIPPGW